MGALYAYTAEEPPSWAATETAVDLMALVGLGPPAELITAVNDALPRVTAEWSDSIVLNTVLPVWQLADALIPDSQRRPLRAQLELILTASLQRASNPATFGGTAVGVIATIRQIAEANGLSGFDTSKASLEALTTPDGYLSLRADRQTPDPQVTCAGISIGLQPGQRLAETVARTAGGLGWMYWSADGPDPESSLYVLLVQQSLGKVTRADSLKRLVSLWLRDSAAHSNPSSWTLTELRRLYFVVALSKILGVNVSVSVTDQIGGLMEVTPSTSGRALEVLLWPLANLINVPLSARARIVIRSRLQSTPSDTIVGVWLLHHAAPLLSELALPDQARHGVTQLLVEDSYRASTQSRVVDLWSTTIALTVLGASRKQRLAAVRPFATASGYSVLPRVQGSSAVDLESVYLGSLASGDTLNAAGLVLPSLFASD